MAHDQVLYEFLQSRGVTRLTHYTPARNLCNILADGRLRSVAEMSADPNAAFAAPDELRRDGHPEKICCSIEYPNIYYLNRARVAPGSRSYPDWACLLISPSIGARSSNLFCFRNAASASGAYIAPGIASLSSCYADKEQGKGQYPRYRNHRRASPTDIQAEVLVADPIPIESILAVAMPTEESLIQERERLKQFGRDPGRFHWRIARGLFDVNAITGAVQRGRDILEAPWPLDSDGSVG